MSEPECAWLAAIIDGEGSIRITKGGYKRKDRPGRTSRAVIMSVGNTCPGLIERCKEVTGVGGFVLAKEQTERTRRVYLWTISGSKAINLLHQIFDWLISKRDHAMVIFEYEKIKNERSISRKVGYTDEQNKKIIELHHDIMKLNRRGWRMINDC